MTDFLFRGKLAEVDPAVYELIHLETERQSRKLIMIPSESTAPKACGKRLGPLSRTCMPKDIQMKKPAG